MQKRAGTVPAAPARPCPGLGAGGAGDWARAGPIARITPQAMKSCGRRAPFWVAETCGAASGERGRGAGTGGALGVRGGDGEPCPGSPAALGPAPGTCSACAVWDVPSVAPGWGGRGISPLGARVQPRRWGSRRASRALSEPSLGSRAGRGGSCRAAGGAGGRPGSLNGSWPAPRWAAQSRQAGMGK